MRERPPRQRYDLDYPASHVIFMDHDAGYWQRMGYVVWPCLFHSHWEDKEYSHFMIKGMSSCGQA